MTVVVTAFEDERIYKAVLGIAVGITVVREIAFLLIGKYLGRNRRPG